MGDILHSISGRWDDLSSKNKRRRSSRLSLHPNLSIITALSLNWAYQEDYSLDHKPGIYYSIQMVQSTTLVRSWVRSDSWCYPTTRKSPSASFRFVRVCVFVCLQHFQQKLYPLSHNYKCISHCYLTNGWHLFFNSISETLSILGISTSETRKLLHPLGLFVSITFAY